jgi:general secretion pathway protein M
MSLQLSPAVSRILAVGLLLAALALLWGLVGAPLLNAHADAERTIERLQPLLERSRTVERDITVLQAEVRQAKERRNSPGGFLDGPNESIAGAQLQTRLKLAVERASGDLRSSQVLPGRDDGVFRRVTVRGQVLMNLASLQRVVYDLEASLPYLFLDNIDVQQGGDSRGNKQPDDPVLDVRIDVSGYMRRGT